MIKQIYVEGNVFTFYSVKYGVAYKINGIDYFPYYFDNMRDALNFAYEY
ncbi:MAG: hypothetical protein ACRCX2_10120 [Paraclostridium sp.]